LFDKLYGGPQAHQQGKATQQASQNQAMQPTQALTMQPPAQLQQGPINTTGVGPPLPQGGTSIFGLTKGQGQGGQNKMEMMKFIASIFGGG
jgi:hypothetical protein